VLKIWAEKCSHLLDKFQDTFVGNFIEYKISVFAVIDNPLAAKDVQVLGNIGIGCFYLVPDLTYRKLFVLEETENFQADGMGHRFEQL
jgi:hypothetical protein